MRSHFVRYNSPMENELLKQENELLAGLNILNTQVSKQMSVWFTLRNGIIYGVGFIIGSTLLTATVVTFVLTFFGNTLFANAIMWFAHSR